MSSRITGVTVCALALAAIAAGCGSGSTTTSTSSSSATALTKAEFVKKGNAICVKGHKTVAAAAQNAFPKNQQPSLAAVKKFRTQTLIPAAQSEINGIAALPPPSGDEATVKKMLSTAQADLDQAKANPALLKGNKLFADENTLVRAYGLTACGERTG
jgi:hypothetical protein